MAKNANIKAILALRDPNKITGIRSSIKKNVEETARLEKLAYLLSLEKKAVTFIQNNIGLDTSAWIFGDIDGNFAYDTESDITNKVTTIVCALLDTGTTEKGFANVFDAELNALVADAESMGVGTPAFMEKINKSCETLTAHPRNVFGTFRVMDVEHEVITRLDILKKKKEEKNIKADEKREQRISAVSAFFALMAEKKENK